MAEATLEQLVSMLPERVRIEVGSLDVESLPGRGAEPDPRRLRVRIDGKPVAVSELKIHIEAGDVPLVTATLLPWVKPDATAATRTEVLEALVADLKEESSAYERGLADGRAEGERLARLILARSGVIGGEADRALAALRAKLGAG